MVGQKLSNAIFNEHNQPLHRIVVQPQVNSSSGKPVRFFLPDQYLEAMNYANEGDTLLRVFADGTTQRVTRGAKAGSRLGIDIAQAFLYSGKAPTPEEIIAMCFHPDREAAKEFINELVVDYLNCRKELEKQ